MSYWSNIQASRVNWGYEWKNLWIPNYKWIYTKYFINDYFTLKYIKAKFYGDDKINRTFMYYYDFTLQKTFNKTFFTFKKYNIDFARLIQAAYIGRILNLHHMITKLINTNFFISTMGAKNFVNYLFRPQSYFYFYLLQGLNNSYSVLNLATHISPNFTEDESTTLLGLSSCFFVTKNILTTRTNFLSKDEFDALEYFHYTFNRHNITRFASDKLVPNQVFQEKFKLANFLFNPTILNKYPNFIFFYNSWLHKSWQLAKKWTLESLKLFQSSYYHAAPAFNTVNYFFSWYVRLFAVMKELNVFFKNSEEAGVGLTQEFIRKQVEILHLKLRIRDNMAFRIKEVWFYLKAYLRYFSYEGKINLNRSKIVFKKLFSFKKLIKIASSGINITTPSLISFLETFYFTIVDEKILKIILNFIFFYPNFLKKWYILILKYFVKALGLLRKIFKFRKINVLLKFFLLHKLSNNFINKNFLKIKFTLYPKHFMNENNRNFYNLRYNLNSLIIFYLFFTFSKIQKIEETKIISLTLGIKNFFVPKTNLTVTSKNWKNFINFNDNYFDTLQMLRHSDWFAIIAFHPHIIINFLNFSSIWKLLRKWKFNYFYFILSNLTPKIFFRIFYDLENLSHFSMLIHLFTIYWQNFFFFLFIHFKMFKKNVFTLQPGKFTLFI